jgi:trans-aconitate 2-methyltransferase
MAEGEATVDWDANTYDRVSDPQVEWGRELIDRLELTGDELVLDAGCGSGRVTRMLLERLPNGRLVGVDASPSMIELAREALGSDPRVELVVGDVAALDLDQPVDAIFSNAVFHWVLDHRRLFRSLLGELRPGGRLEAQCGGQGNVAEWKNAIEASHGDERFAQYLRTLPPSYHFASVADTEAQLGQAGFEVERVWTEHRQVTPPEPREYVRSVGLAKELARLPVELHDGYIDSILGSMPRALQLDYVRLNISARRPI